MALNDGVAFWKFNESSGNAADSINSNTLTNNGSATFGAGFYLNGTDLGSGNSGKYFSRSDASGIGTGSYSITGWVNFYSIPSEANYQIVNIGNTANNVTSTMYLHNTGGVTTEHFERVRDGVASDAISVTNTPSTSTWLFWAMTYDGSTLTAYVNGSSVGTVASTGSGSSGTTLGTAIGSLVGGGQYASIKADAFGLWTRALSGAEITTLYNGGVSGAIIEYPFVGSLTINVSDSTAVTSTPTIVVITNLFASVSDSTSVSDSIIMQRFFTIGVSDSTAVSDGSVVSYFWPNQPKSSTSWTDATKSSSIWTDQSKSSSAFANQTKS